MDRKKLGKILIYLILVIFAANFVANELYWYYTIWYFDMIMHFIGGFWIGLLFFYIFPEKYSSKNVVALVALFVFMIGVGWEVFEVLVSNTFAKNPFNILDTSSDLVFDLTGGLSATFYFFKKLCLREKIG